MKAFPFFACIFLTYAPDCRADGAIARGYAGTTLRFTTARDLSTPRDAESAARNDCWSQGLTYCDTVTTFRNVCVSVAISPAGFYHYAEGENPDEARQTAITTCVQNRRTTCTEVISTCDKTPEPARAAGSEIKPILNEPAPTRSEIQQPVPAFDTRVFRENQVILGSAYAAATIDFVLFLWILASLISTTSVDVLKRRAAISAWIALPSLPAAVVSVLGLEHGVVATYVLVALFLWTDVYTAFVTGVWFRRLLSGASRSPAILSLPIANLVFTAVSFGAGFLFIEYGTVPNTLTCGHPPYDLLSGCGYFEYEGFYVAAAALLVLIVCGATLPANSNLIRAYDWLNARIRQSLFLSGRRQPEPVVPEPLEEPEPQFTPRSNTNETRQEWDKSAIKKAVRAKREEFEL